MGAVTLGLAAGYGTGGPQTPVDRDALDGVVTDFRINWVWMPPWGPENITEDGREQLRALGVNI